MRRSRYLGRGQIAICARSGEKIHASELVRDGRLTSLLVSPDWADEAHPQERPYVPNDLEGTPRFPISPENPKPTVAPVLAATAGVLRVNLSWSAASRAAGPRIEEYDILRDSGSGYTLIHTTLVEYNVLGGITGPTRVYTDLGLTAGVSYAYKVVALTSNNRGLTSNVASATPTP